MRIWKDFKFEAAHVLPLVPEGHKCGRLHGHSYRVRVEVEGPVGDDGMVVDFALLKDAWRPLHEALDHRLLNEVDGLANPTAENLARWVFGRFGRLPAGVSLAAVEVHETASSGVRFP